MVKQADTPTGVTDIVAHLFYAAGHASEVIVTSSEGDCVGTLCYPEGNGVVIACRLPSWAAAPGATICVEYAGPADTYRFYTEIVSSSPGRIVAAYPFAVERNRGRLAERVVVPPDAGFHYRAGDDAAPRSHPILDLSVGGLAFVDPADAGLKVGDLDSGRLCLPDEEPIAVGIEVRHLGLRRGQFVVGGRFAAMSIRDRLRLATYLVGLAALTRSSGATGPDTSGGAR